MRAHGARDACSTVWPAPLPTTHDLRRIPRRGRHAVAPRSRHSRASSCTGPAFSVSPCTFASGALAVARCADSRSGRRDFSKALIRCPTPVGVRQLYARRPRSSEGSGGFGSPGHPARDSSGAALRLRSPRHPACGPPGARTIRGCTRPRASRPTLPAPSLTRRRRPSGIHLLHPERTQTDGLHPRGSQTDRTLTSRRPAGSIRTIAERSTRTGCTRTGIRPAPSNRGVGQDLRCRRDQGAAARTAGVGDERCDRRRVVPKTGVGPPTHRDHGGFSSELSSLGLTDSRRVCGHASSIAKNPLG